MPVTYLVKCSKAFPQKFFSYFGTNEKPKLIILRLSNFTNVFPFPGNNQVNGANN